ncbi:tRNA wybutosine-synthesizing protein 3 homolog isoform X1 [Anabrus simplex]|uniref:tRNA wybutosine-synthesizing protein 3 homolog isoform X1 n=1 Tax=Anabrus simplex TaxID=316456 RepID=UPI0034DCEA89
MTPLEFRNQKRQILSGADLSQKGSIDKPIEDLINLINSKDDFVTTSSCSGRVILYCESAVEGRKKGCKWLYTTHDLVNVEEFLSKVDSTEGDLVLKFEPMILHIQCISLEKAKSVHVCAVQSGFRNSGISVGKHHKIIVAVRSCMGLEVPLSSDGRLMVSDEYLKFLAGVANNKMIENQERTERFSTSMKLLLQ